MLNIFTPMAEEPLVEQGSAPTPKDFSPKSVDSLKEQIFGF